MSETELPTVVGINTTTIKEIQNKGKYSWYLENSLNEEIDQKSRFESRPEYLPFTFGIGGGLSYLEDTIDNKPVWKTTKWEGDPPKGYNIGEIYFVNSQLDRHVKVADNPQGGWVWQNLDDKEEQLSWKAKEGWQYRIYFNTDYKRSAELNNQMNDQGWTRYSINDEENLILPENLESQELEADLMGDHRRRNFIICDNNRAEIMKVTSRQSGGIDEEQLKKEGWEFVDSNIARAIYIRTKQDSKE